MLEQKTNKVYLRPIDGTISEKCEQSTPGAVKRLDKDGVEKYDIQYNSIIGNITSFSISETKFGERLDVNISDGGQECTLQLQVNSSYFSSFVSKIGNVDLEEKVEIKTYSFVPKDRDKKIAGLNFYQRGNKVEPVISKDNHPEGYPEPEGDTSKYDKDDWKMYFIKKTKWEKEYVKNFKFPEAKLVTPEQVAKGLGDVDFDVDSITADNDTPF